MLDFARIDPTFDRDPNPLREAEDRVAEAEAAWEQAFSDYLQSQSLDAMDYTNILSHEVDTARADLAALRAKLAAQADGDGELPVTARDL